MRQKAVCAVLQNDIEMHTHTLAAHTMQFILDVQSLHKCTEHNNDAIFQYYFPSTLESTFYFDPFRNIRTSYINTAAAVADGKCWSKSLKQS